MATEDTTKEELKHYNILIDKTLVHHNTMYRVEATNEKEARKKVKELGFNCGVRLSSTYTGEFNISNIEEVKPSKVEDLDTAQRIFICPICNTKSNNVVYNKYCCYSRRG